MDIIAKIEFKADELTVENEDRKYKNTTENIDFTVTEDNGKSQKEVTGKAHFKTEALITENEDHNNILEDIDLELTESDGQISKSLIEKLNFTVTEKGDEKHATVIGNMDFTNNTIYLEFYQSHSRLPLVLISTSKLPTLKDSTKSNLLLIL